MNQRIELPEESFSILQRQASTRGLSVQEWISMIALEKEGPLNDDSVRQNVEEAVCRILELQRHVKPDPDGWTARDYIDHGRR